VPRRDPGLTDVAGRVPSRIASRASPGEHDGATSRLVVKVLPRSCAKHLADRWRGLVGAPLAQGRGLVKSSRHVRCVFRHQVGAQGCLGHLLFHPPRVRRSDSWRVRLGKTTSAVPRSLDKATPGRIQFEGWSSPRSGEGAPQPAPGLQLISGPLRLARPRMRVARSSANRSGPAGGTATKQARKVDPCSRGRLSSEAADATPTSSPAASASSSAWPAPSPSPQAHRGRRPVSPSTSRSSPDPHLMKDLQGPLRPDYVISLTPAVVRYMATHRSLYLRKLVEFSAGCPGLRRPATTTPWSLDAVPTAGWSRPARRRRRKTVRGEPLCSRPAVGLPLPHALPVRGLSPVSPR